MNVYVTFGVLLLSFIAIYRYYWKTFRKLRGIALYHLPFGLLHYQFSGKKYASVSNFVLEYVKEKCLENMKEGLWLTYITGPVLMIFGEEPVKVLSTEKAAATKPSSLYHLYEDRIGSGLITENGEIWRKHRKMLNAVVTHALLKDKVPLFNKHALALVKDLENQLVNKQSIDILYSFKTHYFNALSESIFGMKQTEENKADALKYFHNMDSLGAETIHRAVYPWLHWKFMLRTSSYGRQILQEYEETFKFTKNAILKMKEHVSSEKTTDAACFSKDMRKSLTYLLLQHQLEDPSFTFEDVHGQASNFMSAGYSTVSYATLWCLFMLGLYPDVQEKAYNEVQFISTEDNISFDDCSSFKYLESVILETLRLYPTIPIFIRELSEEVQCGKRIIPKGTVLGFVPYAIHRNPDIYPDPEKFDPERFLGTNQINSWNYIPFAEGYRNCLGKKYALIEMKIFLAHFLKKFKITSLDRREDVGLCWNVVLAPTKPIRMRIERRCCK